MKARAKARRYAHNNREYILFSRQQAGDCTFCPRHDGENERGCHAKWGKKRALKTYYATGKQRKAPKRIRDSYLSNGIMPADYTWRDNYRYVWRYPTHYPKLA